MVFDIKNLTKETLVEAKKSLASTINNKTITCVKVDNGKLIISEEKYYEKI